MEPRFKTLTHLRQFDHNIIFFFFFQIPDEPALLFFNTSRQLQFQKNLKNRFRKKYKSVDSESKNDPFPSFRA